MLDAKGLFFGVKGLLGLGGIGAAGWRGSTTGLMPCLALGLWLAPAGAEDREARLRDVAERVAVLATSWEPDLKAAMQGLAPEVGPGWGVTEFWPRSVLTDPKDPMMAEFGFQALLTGSGHTAPNVEKLPFIYVNCLRTGRPTLQDLLTTYRFEPGKSVARMDGGKVGRPVSFDQKLSTLQVAANAGYAERLPEVRAVLDCKFDSPFDGTLTAADWDALSDGLQTRFANVEPVEDPDLSPDRWKEPQLSGSGSIMEAGTARDSSILVPRLRVGQVGDDTSGPLEGVIFLVVVMRLAEGS